MPFSAAIPSPRFPFLFGGTFIEGDRLHGGHVIPANFPSFSEGLSLRVRRQRVDFFEWPISLPFRRDFH